MSVTIKSIHIENFRSIQSLDVNLSQLSVFVGRNDSGKSNILRAVNLFFNEQTNPGSAFNFEEDYNFFSPARSRRAKEITVRLEIELPNSYHETNGQVIIWEKKWRESGLWSEDYEYFGERISLNRRGNEVRERVEIPDKSNVHALLRKIEFEYVPAIKDSEYFNDLRGRIYGIISEVASRTFHESSAAFELSIGDHLNELTASITNSLGLDTRLALPRDLYHIFERLDFLSGEKRVSLNNRGDGIKARHIPLILRYMAEKKAALQRRGGSPISSIWAYEEPENNLEFASAIQLADELLSLSRANTAQILLTTHSPAFYDLGQREEDVQLNFVTRNSDAEGTIARDAVDGIDESLGTLAMIAPRVSQLVSEVRKQEAARAEALRLAERSCARVFVEGESDRIILSHALKIYFPNAVDKIYIETKANGAGYNYVIDMLIGWRSQHKHNPEGPRAAGIVDSDAESSKNEFNRLPDNIKSAKCFMYPKIKELISAHELGFRIPSTLETLYPIKVWETAKERGHLQERELLKVYPKSLVDEIIKGKSPAKKGLDPAWAIYAEYDFNADKKVSTARNLTRIKDEEFRKTFPLIEGLMRNILNYTGIPY